MLYLQHYGAQAVVVSIDPKRVYVADPAQCSHNTVKAKQQGPNGEEYCWYQCTVKGGREGRDLDAVQLAQAVEALGAGEILLNSIDADGACSGFDLELIQAVSDAVTIPVIASSGAGSPEHFSQVFNNTKASAALAAGIFHRQEVAISDVKSHMAAGGLPTRTWHWISWWQMCFKLLVSAVSRWFVVAAWATQQSPKGSQLLVRTRVDLKVQRCSLGHLSRYAQLVSVCSFVWSLRRDLWYRRAKLHVMLEFSLHAYAWLIDNSMMIAELSCNYLQGIFNILTMQLIWAAHMSAALIFAAYAAPTQVFVIWLMYVQDHETKHHLVWQRWLRKSWSTRSQALPIGNLNVVFQRDFGTDFTDAPIASVTFAARANKHLHVSFVVSN
jgi:hypothetical protein